MRSPWFWCNGTVAQMCLTKYPYAQLPERLKKKKRKEKNYTQMFISHLISNNNLCLQL